MKISNPFSKLTRFEWFLWIFSVIVVVASFFLSETDPLTFVASLVGVTALIFLAKGMVSGQVLVIIFAVLYAVISFKERYYGEMITYALMTAPMAILAMIAWIKNPYGKGEEVRVSTLNAKKLVLTLLLTALVTVVFYFILGALGTANLTVSTLSIATSFFAAALTYLRSPYYAIGYVLNDVVLIALWVSSALSDSSYIPVVACFVMFLFNDLYGFFNWRKMKKRQQKS